MTAPDVISIVAFLDQEHWADGCMADDTDLDASYVNYSSEILRRLMIRYPGTDVTISNRSGADEVTLADSTDWNLSDDVRERIRVIANEVFTRGEIWVGIEPDSGPQA